MKAGRPQKGAQGLPCHTLHARYVRGRGKAAKARQFYGMGCSVPEISAFLEMRSHAVRQALMNFPMAGSSRNLRLPK